MIIEINAAALARRPAAKYRISYQAQDAVGQRGGVKAGWYVYDRSRLVRTLGDHGRLPSAAAAIDELCSWLKGGLRP